MSRYLATVLLLVLLGVALTSCCDSGGDSGGACCRLAALDTCDCEDLSWDSTAQATLAGGDDKACQVTFDGIIDRRGYSTAEEFCEMEGDLGCYQQAKQTCD